MYAKIGPRVIFNESYAWSYLISFCCTPPLTPTKSVFQRWHRKNRYLYSAGLPGPPGQGVRIRGCVRMCRDPETTATQHGPNPGNTTVLLSVDI